MIDLFDLLIILIKPFNINNMPIGSYALTYNIAHEIWKRKPESVLDLGIGFGMQGALVRQYVDQGIQPFKTRLIGVEGFEEYRNPVWDIYDNVVINDIKEWVDVQTDYGLYYTPAVCFDMIIMTDVIEHFEKEEGFEIAKDLMKLLNPGGIVLIGTPGIFQEQGAAYGNEYERHRSAWSAFDFPAGYEIIQDGSPDRDGHQMILVKYTRPV